MDKNDKIMTQYLTKNLVDHRHVGLASKTIAEFSLHHRERGFNVRPLVVVLQKLFALELKVMERFVPNAAPIVASGVRLESNERLGSDAFNGLKVRPRGVSPISRHFGDLKVLCRGINKRGEQRRVIGVPTMNLDGGNDVRFDAAHNVALDPIVLLLNNTVLVVKPSREMTGGETRRIDGKIRLNRPQRQRTLFNQFVKNGRQFRVLKVVRDAVKMRHLSNETPAMRFPQIAHETPLRYRRIDLERGSKERIGQRQAWTTSLAWRRDQTGAQISQEQLKLILLMGLRLIVSRPVLGIGLLSLRHHQTFGNCHSSVRVLFPLHHKGCGINVLALNPASLMVGAGASGNLRPNSDLVFGSVTRLRRDEPNPVLLLNLSGCCQFQTTLFSRFHDNLASLENILLSRGIVVKGYFQKSFKKLLDTISVSSILLKSWQWSQSNKRGINVIAAPMSGYPEKPRMGSLEFAPNANRHIGIGPERTRERICRQPHKTSLAEREGFEPPTRGLATSASDSQSDPLPGSGISPLNDLSSFATTEINHVGGEGASQTFAPHLRSLRLLFLLFRFISSNWRSNRFGYPCQKFLRDRERKHIFSCIPSYRKRPSFRPIVVYEIEKRDSGEACTAPTFRTVGFKRICPVIFFLHRLNTNRMRGFVPPQKYKRFLVLSEDSRTTVINGEATIVGDRNFRSATSYKISGKDLKRHKANSFPQAQRIDDRIANRMAECP